MMLEAVWFKNGKEISWVSPVMNIVCDEDMRGFSDIEIFNGEHWYSCNSDKADDFTIRIKR